MERKYWKSQGKIREICQSENMGTMRWQVTRGHVLSRAQMPSTTEARLQVETVTARIYAGLSDMSTFGVCVRD